MPMPSIDRRRLRGEGSIYRLSAHPQPSRASGTYEERDIDVINARPISWDAEEAHDMQNKWIVEVEGRR